MTQILVAKVNKAAPFVARKGRGMLTSTAKAGKVATLTKTRRQVTLLY